MRLSGLGPFVLPQWGIPSHTFRLYVMKLKGVQYYLQMFQLFPNINEFGKICEFDLFWIIVLEFINKTNRIFFITSKICNNFINKLKPIWFLTNIQLQLKLINYRLALSIYLRVGNSLTKFIFTDQYLIWLAFFAGLSTPQQGE